MEKASKSKGGRRELLGKIGYASGDIYGGGAFLIVGVLLLAFLTNIEGLSGTWAGIIIFIGKAWDAITDPIMGSLSDRTESRFGRRRVYFLAGALPVFASWVMLWYSFGITGEAAKIAYYIFAYIFFSTAFTIVMVPYNSILADMTNDYNKRSGYTGVRLSFSAGAAIICGIVPGMITGAYKAAPATGYLVMALTFGAVFGLSWLAAFAGTWENNKSKERAGFTYKEWVSVFKNKSFRHYVAMFVFSQIAVDITMALAVFYLSATLHKDYLFVPAMAAILSVQLIFIGIFTVVSQKFGKRVPALVAGTVWIIANVFISMFSPQTPDVVIVVVCALIGVGGAGCNLSSWSILPDITDVDELITGERREGIYAGVSTFLRKMSGGLAVGAVGFLLDAFHYSEAAVKANAVEPLTNLGIKLTFCVVPALFMAAMIYVIRGYVLGRKEFNVLQGVLARYRKEGAAVVLSEEEAGVCSELTGMSADKLCGKG